MAKFDTKIVARGQHRITVRSELDVDGDKEVVEHTLDVSDGSEIAQRLVKLGDYGKDRLRRMRAQLAERARTKAQTMARNRLLERRMADDERVELRTRLPLQPTSQGLKALEKLYDRINKARD